MLISGEGSTVARVRSAILLFEMTFIEIAETEPARSRPTASMNRDETPTTREQAARDRTVRAHFVKTTAGSRHVVSTMRARLAGHAPTLLFATAPPQQRRSVTV